MKHGNRSKIILSDCDFINCIHYSNNIISVNNEILFNEIILFRSWCCNYMVIRIFLWPYIKKSRGLKFQNWIDDYSLVLSQFSSKVVLIVFEQAYNTKIRSFIRVMKSCKIFLLFVDISILEFFPSVNVNTCF